VIGLTAGVEHMCAWRGDDVFCWGSNSYGEVGDGTTTLRTIPVRVDGLSDVRHMAVAEGYTCAVEKRGTVVCWGKVPGAPQKDRSWSKSSSPEAVLGWPPTTAVRD